MSRRVFRWDAGVGRAMVFLIGVTPSLGVWAAQSGLPKEQGIAINDFGVFMGDEKINTVPVDGVVETVTASTPVNSYDVRNGGVLNVIDGGVIDVAVVLDSRINVIDGVVNRGVVLSGSQTLMERAVIRSDTGSALRLAPASYGDVDRGSEAVVNSGDISGIGRAINLGVSGSLQIANTSVHGADSAQTRGVGVAAAGAKLLSISESSHVRGNYIGIDISHASDSGGQDLQPKSTVVIDGSAVEGVEGAAIRVGNPGYNEGTIADITIQNRSSLLSGNGNLLEADDQSAVNLKVDNSDLNGNLIADDTSNLNITLQNDAQLTGNIVNSKQLAINSGARWTMTEDAQVNSLSLDGGRVSFGDPGDGAFKTLNLNALSGNGTFDMRINLDEREGDLLKVNGTANGDHQLRVKNTGVEVVEPDMQPYLLVDTNGGDARFSLAGARADLGVYSYELEQLGDDWFIVGSGKIISPSTQSVLALFNAAPNIWNSELSTLRSRMGEVRGKEQAGGWIRAYGSRFNASTSEGVDYRNSQSGLSLGADAPLPVSVGQLSVGLMTGYSKNDLDIGRGTSGKVGSYYVGGYGTWLLDDGYYLDGVLKLNRFRNESKVAMSDGAKAKGNYQSTGIGGSLEFGRHIKFADGYFLEPFTQLSSVWVQGDSYTLDNGMRADNNRTQSVLGKVGASAGRSIALKDGGVLQPYLRVAAAHEFSRNNEVEVNKTRFDNQLSGSRSEVGAGVSVSLSERLQLHADFDYMKGKGVEQPWGANVGLKLAF